MKIEIQNFTVVKHFKESQTMSIVCDASRDELGAVLQQKTEEGWKATTSHQDFWQPLNKDIQ